MPSHLARFEPISLAVNIKVQGGLAFQDGSRLILACANLLLVNLGTSYKHIINLAASGGC